MHKNIYTILFAFLSLLSIQAQESNHATKELKSPYYMEITLTNEMLIRLKAFEPLDEEKIKALVFIKLISKPQSEFLKQNINDKGIILLPELEDALKETELSMENIVSLVRLFPGPFSEEILDKLVLLKVIRKSEKFGILSIITKDGYLPGIPKEKPVIEVKDEWNGIPVTSYGMIDSNALLSKKFPNGLPEKLKKLIEKHRTYFDDLAEATEVKRVSRAKDMQKAKEKMKKKVISITEKMNDVEADIAKQKHLMGYLYLAGTYQSRYNGNLESAKNIKTDRSNLVKALLNDAKDQNSPMIDKDRNLFSGVEKFILLDKTLLWMTNKTNADHRDLAKSALMILLQGHGHPPWDANEVMWMKWWDLQQKNFYLELSETK